ncbi:unnamed protein product [Schistosoma curassoni]|uniref:Cystatin domain-containing protein n=1 Tax=Schistosoma curassoni TaxID=6186 RepID=A0A183JGY9_9TREM|nr:unnamed protein product [Schistosoma curassoni]
MLMYSGHEEENAPQTQAIAQILSREARNEPKGWESHRYVISGASFKTKKKGVTMNAIQCYAPTNDSNDDDKDRSYKELQSTIAEC